ncbi:MAG: tRNA (guanosine(37)-N1)-methyltransferase TrmD [Lachnospiraceae bacterium]|nr:tRNA (guanosine(37)-N1)-methyltransferase TrmD [Lachnospiraceae bacterium]
MNFHILTLFPEMVLQGLHTSIIGRALEKGYIFIEAVNIRDYTLNKHGKVDDYTYGGGAGMLMQAQPVYDAYIAVLDKIAERKSRIGEMYYGDKMAIEQRTGSDIEEQKRTRVIYVSPQGRTFHQKLAQELAWEEDLIFLCGHYEGIDERVLEEIVTDEISIGDYVLTGGELPAMVMVDAIARLVPGVLHNADSAVTESFYDGLLEYPQYSRPEIWHDKRVPQILLSGDHAKVDAWRLEQSIERTKQRRPDLYEAYVKQRE